MRPIAFSCTATLPFPAETVAARILDVSQWADFPGCWPIPGIRLATVEKRTDGIVGSIIRVTNRDGSSHVEEITEWAPPRRLVLELKDFSSPLSRVASHFVETWEMEAAGQGTKVRRSFQLHGRSNLTRPALWLISIFLRRAIVRHLELLVAPRG